MTPEQAQIVGALAVAALTDPDIRNDAIVEFGVGAIDGALFAVANLAFPDEVNE